MGLTDLFWDRVYRGTPSWELGEADPELIAALDTRSLPGPVRALEVGCGTGDNAIELAKRGFAVTAIDIAERPLALAQAKAAAAGMTIDFRVADVTRLDDLEGSFDLLVDRGLLMSLFGERARREYASALTRLVADGGGVYQDQWELPEIPSMLSPGWLVTRFNGVVLAPGELERRLGSAFSVEVVRRSVEPTDDPGIRRLGIRRVAKTTYWLQRRPDDRSTDRR